MSGEGGWLRKIAYISRNYEAVYFPILFRNENINREKRIRRVTKHNTMAADGFFEAKLFRLFFHLSSCQAFVFSLLPPPLPSSPVTDINSVYFVNFTHSLVASFRLYPGSLSSELLCSIISRVSLCPLCGVFHRWGKANHQFSAQFCLHSAESYSFCLVPPTNDINEWLFSFLLFFNRHLVVCFDK